jgi:multidrug efflux system membrane fusion protein
VYVVDDANTVVMRSVELGPYTANDVVIRSGLAAGDKVIVEGLQKVRAGVLVDPQPISLAVQAD